MMIQIEIPACHEAKSSPQTWDSEFEKFLCVTTAEGYLRDRINEDRMGTAKRHEEKLEEYASHPPHLCVLQYEVSNLAAHAMIYNNLAFKWLGASVAERKKHVLIGIAGACGSSPNLNKARFSCAKELRVSYLSSDGQILLDLINSIAPADLSQVPIKVQYINNEEWDKVRIAHKDSQDEVEKLALSYILVLRTKLITYVLHFIICSFLGHELPKITVQKKGHSRNNPTPTPMELFIKQGMIAKYGKEAVDKKEAVYNAAFKERTAKKVNNCCGCGRAATKREMFKKCKGCWKIDREVLYCSRECQIANWKLEHKLICGKPLYYDLAVKLATIQPTSDQSNSNNDSEISPPADGFKRSLDLLIQIKHLKDIPEADYVIYRSNYTNNEKYAFMFYSEPFGTIFRKHRDNAIKTGDRVSAALMCDFFFWDIEMRKATDFRMEMVIEQVSREYAYPIDELEEALMELRKYRDSVQNEFPALARPGSL